jgi:starch synthase
MAGGIELADIVIAVSENYATEIRRPETGFGLDEQLNDLGDRLIGIRNGIDTGLWSPATDHHIAERYTVDHMTGKLACRQDLLKSVGWTDSDVPIVGIVSRLVEQKGIDLALDASRFASTMPFRLVVLGSGEKWLADRATKAADADPLHVWFSDAYDVELGHKIFAGADLMLMPSRFEPCGLAQMQAMEYGTIPVVTAVGGLVDTVIDFDADPEFGTGFVSESVDLAGVVDALHRAVRALSDSETKLAMQQRGMTTDWSWTEPARQHIRVYESVGTLSRS